MSVYYVPVLQPVEFPLFRDVCDDGCLPETFEDWSTARMVQRRALSAEGHHVIGVYVAPEVLRQHCRSMRCAADVAAMDVLAMRIGSEIYDTPATYQRVRAETVVVDDTRSVGVRAPIDGGPVPRRHWWQFWRRRPVYVAETVEVVDASTPRHPVYAMETLDAVDAPPPRRHWWQFWRRRPVYAVGTRRHPYPAE